MKAPHRAYEELLSQNLFSVFWVGLRRLFRGFIDRGRYSSPQTLDVDTAARSPQFRGMHRLVLRDDGSTRCVACHLCQTACPARCIHIVADEAQVEEGEKRPAVFEVDELRCVVCGLCVEACPCDALRMDTGVYVPPVYSMEEVSARTFDLIALSRQGCSEEGQQVSNKDETWNV